MIKFTTPKKWDDVWFSELTMEGKVMFMYLCDMCDIAGFLEVNERITKLRTGIQDVRGTIESLSKSVILKGDHVWVKQHIKHQKNLPINVKNGAHKSILNIIRANIDRFPEIFEYLPISDGEVVRQYIEGGGGASPRGGLPPIGIGNSISISESNEVTNDEIKSETLLTRLYKYFVGEENLMTESVTSGTREILAEAIRIMDVEKWKIYCDARLKDGMKAAPRKFFLEDGWRRYHDEAKAIEREQKQAEARREESKKRESAPRAEAPDDFKEFVKTFGKRKNKAKRESYPAS